MPDTAGERAWGGFLLSLPERVVRSTSAVAGGLLRELGEVTIPRPLRQSQLYQNLVEATLRFMIEKVGKVDGVYTGEKLSEDFLMRRTAGSGVEFIGILAFRASPVWVLAALADASARRESCLISPGPGHHTVAAARSRPAEEHRPHRVLSRVSPRSVTPRSGGVHHDFRDCVPGYTKKFGERSEPLHG